MRPAVPLLPSALARIFCAAVSGLSVAAAPAPAPVTPASILAAAPAGDWAGLDPDNTLVLNLARGGSVVIALAPGFAPVHVGNIQALARAHWFDGLTIERVQENYVVQWGDADGRKSLPAGVAATVPSEYERSAAGLTFRPLPYRDTFASRVGFVGGWPVAEGGGKAWLAHCYGMVGVGRDNAPDTGSGAELYAVIGHAPRQLDRNIALVGRVVAGIEAMSALPRGTATLGFYATPAERVPIARVRLASELPPAERPQLEMLRTDGASFTAWVKARANRKDAFYIRPAGAIDLCGALPPVRTIGG